MAGGHLFRRPWRSEVSPELSRQPSPAKRAYGTAERASRRQDRVRLGLFHNDTDSGHPAPVEEWPETVVHGLEADPDITGLADEAGQMEPCQLLDPPRHRRAGYLDVNLHDARKVRQATRSS